MPEVLVDMVWDDMLALRALIQEFGEVSSCS